MSAFGQKQTFECASRMSTILPKTNAKMCALGGTAADMIQATIFLASADMVYVMATHLRVEGR